METFLQKAFAPFKRYLPDCLWNPLRSTATGFLTPLLFSYRTGHFRSSLARRAVSRQGEPLPWYTFPCIDFLKYRSYYNRDVLEFGGGQSTLWWAARARRVVTLEGDYAWFRALKHTMPDNVDLHYVSMADSTTNVRAVEATLRQQSLVQYAVIIIDGLYRFEMIEFARNYIAEDGIIICDNAEGYGFYEGFQAAGFCRVDFFGHVPGVVLPQATSIFFKPGAFVFNARYPIPAIAREL
jgi:hypothetical protein